ncbi:hypothetical protein DFH08DRAFT_947254 [Mycena albidolilacea]|uniref:Uncharacterized protein n=1 Tax=Mycena albidolilacea TaxID=1033008 RepID=A0AAD7AUU8_9AGAR|nr:hypothetical protein DFH08DRAFT_947254 [Mycena albidolilacea]
MPRVSPKPTCWKAKPPAIIACFTEARPNHQCRRRVPIVPFDVYPDEKEVGCLDTSNILSLLDFLSRPDAKPTFSQAVEWYTEYTNATPTWTMTRYW